MFRNVVRVATLSFLLLLIPTVTFAQVSLTTMGTPYTQNFDTLIPSGSTTWTNNSNIPGWFHARTGTGTTIVANDGASNAGNFYSYGTGTATDRALGSLGSGNAAVGNLFWGVRLQNNTGATITQFDVAYVGEQWRNSAAAAQTIDVSYLVGSPTVTGTLAEFQSAGVAVPSLNFTGPITGGAAGALNGNLPANRVSIMFSITGLSIPNGTEVMLRWSDPDHTGADHGLSIDDFAVTPQGGPPPNPPVVPTCPATVSTTFGSATTAPVSATDSNGTVTSATITGITPSNPGTITLTGFTPAGGVGGTANATLDVSNTTPVGSYNVTIQWANNDGVPQTANCIVAVNVTAPVVITFIHDIQGSGASSPLVGNNVNIRGIVTGVKSNGFFVQEEDADADANPLTSEGIFVFTSGAPPAAAAFTAQVQVNGTVSEFVPSGDPQQPPLTELSGTISVTQLAAPGQPLPTAITFTTTNPDPAGPFDQLEKYEGMRVSAASMTVVGPSDGTVNETNATGTSNGRFHGVVTGIARPFREPGIQAPDVPPVGTVPPIPRWDTNPERLRIESATINAQPVLTVKSGDVVAPVTGPLDYGFRGYAIYPDGTLGTPVVTPGTLNTLVTTPTANEFTVASFNLERFFDTVNDPESDAVLTATAFNNRLMKASVAIRNHLKFPDVVGVQEMEHLTTLQALATQINNDAVANAQPNPMYVAYLTEGNDVGGIDVGYLVKTATVPGGAMRVVVNSVTQVGGATTWIDPSTNSSALLNDRPPLVLDATINKSTGVSFPVIVINNHLRSLIGIDDPTPSGFTTTADRVQRKRQTQADFLAQYIQGRLTATPGEHIVVIGDMNNFEFNDGYQDSMDTIQGTPVPDNQTVVCATCPTTPNTGDGVDQLNPDLVNLVNTPPAPERYSYNFEGNVQNIDHAVVSAGVVTDTSARRIEHPRIDADYPETERNTNTTAFRISDHDPVVAYFTPLAFSIADVSMTKTLTTSGPYVPGQSITYTLDVANAGPDPATNIQVTDTPTNLSITGVSGSGCSALPCTISSVNAGSNTIINVTATIVAAGAFDNSANATGAEPDPNTANNTDNTGNGGTAVASADVSLTKNLDTAGPYFAGQSVTYTITVANAGPSTATNIQVTDTPTNLSITGVSGSGCAALPCTIVSLASGANTAITVTATIVAAGAFDNSANATGAEPDPNTANNTDNTGNGGTAAASADVSANKTLDTAGPYFVGQSVTYTITVANAGPSTATNINVTDTPANLTITNVSGACASFSPCTIASIASGANTTITVTATIVAAGAFDNSATATASENDPNTANNTDNTGNGGTAIAAADVSMTKTLNTSGPYFVGQTISYTLTVANAGASTATNINVTDTPTNLTITSVSGACTSFSPCTIASLNAGTNAVINMTATITAAGMFDNSATATATEFDPNTANNTDNTGNAGTTGNAADLSVAKSIITVGPYHQGDSVQFQIVVANAGPNTATNVLVTDTPIGVTTTNVTGGGCTSFPCTIPSLANGANVPITLTGTIQNPGPFDNSSTVSATEFDPNTSNNSDLSGNGGVAAASANVSVNKTLDTAGPYFVGQSVTFTITVANAGPATATNVNVTDTPANLTITNVSGACTSFSPCTIASIASGANTTITVTATIVAAGAFDNSATATASENDPNTANNTDNTGNGGIATVNPDTDGDGVDDTIEQGAPNGGDGNGDGIPDSQQNTVASIPAATGSGYLTLQSSCQLQQVTVATEGAQAAADSGFDYPHGLIAFRAPCSSATFSLFIYGSAPVSVYRKYGPLPPGGPQQWYPLPGATFSVATVGSLNPTRVDFSLTDGGTGDDTPVDGVIVDQGGPGRPVSDIPTLSEWALIALAMALAAFGALKLRT